MKILDQTTEFKEGEKRGLFTLLHLRMKQRKSSRRRDRESPWGKKGKQEGFQRRW